MEQEQDTHIVNTEEKNIYEVGAYAAHNFERSNLKPTNFESLPDDVVFEILARVPAHDIYNAARLVCSKWYKTTRTHDFVRAHLQPSTCGILTQPMFGSQSNKQLLFAAQKGQRIIEISKHNFTGNILSSCNGLILECHYKKPELKFLIITNPATNQHLNLPSFVPDNVFYNYAIACDVASKEYKVVSSFYNSKSGEVGCGILTVGVDKDWKRRVEIQHLSPAVKKLLRQPPSTTQGFVHWARSGRSRDSEYVLTLNVETEIITQSPAVPPSLLCGCDGETKLLYQYLPMGSYLSLLIGRVDQFPTLDQVWVMKPETGEWTKMMSFDTESQKRAFEGVSAPLNRMLRPVGWLKFREVLVFRSSNSSRYTRFCIAYNVRTHEIESLKLDFSPYRFIVHRNSLVWLDGC